MDKSEPTEICIIGNLIAGEENQPQITPDKLRLYGRRLIEAGVPEGKVLFYFSGELEALADEYLLNRFDIMAGIEAELHSTPQE